MIFCKINFHNSYFQQYFIVVFKLLTITKSLKERGLRQLRMLCSVGHDINLISFQMRVHGRWHMKVERVGGVGSGFNSDDEFLGR